MIMRLAMAHGSMSRSILENMRGVQKVRSAGPWIEECCSTTVTQNKREDDHAEI